MIIARYLTRQVLLSTAAITLILLVVVVVGRFLKYLAEASQGALDPSVLALLMSYRLPEFLQLILPLALLLGILLSYGRMYADSEMTVLMATGLSQRRLLGITLLPAAVFMVVVGLLALKVTPWGLTNSETLLQAQEDLTEFEILVPGIFQPLARGERTTYTEGMDGEQLRKVFMHERANNRVIHAASAVPREDAAGNRYILLRDGTLAQGIPGQEAFSLTRFDELNIRLPPRELTFDLALEEKALPTLELLDGGQPAQAAELQWRLSLVVLIPILTLVAIPLSRVSPREGRFAKLVPAILLYIAYFGLLLASRDLLGEGSLPAWLGLWWVHALFLALGALLFSGRQERALAWLGQVRRQAAAHLPHSGRGGR